MTTETPDLTPFRRTLEEARKASEARLREGGDAFAVVQTYTRAIDGLVQSLAEVMFAADRRRVALVAVGGTGRQELCPHSDLDLLILHTAQGDNSGVERLVPTLWDVGLKLGHSVRTPRECYRWMLDDSNTATALLDARYLWGSEALFHKFHDGSLARYRRRRHRAFVREQLALLLESLDDPARTIYAIEPRLKDGICGLRDIQRVRWIESVQSGVGGFQALQRKGKFSSERVAALEGAYEFLLRVRCELHHLNGVRLDILERDSQADVAQHLGYGEGGEVRSAVEELMGTYYRHSRDVYRFLRFYVETETRGRRFFGGLARGILAERLSPSLSLYHGRVWLTREPPEGGSPAEIVGIFRAAQEAGARLSESLCEWIRRRVEWGEDDWTHSATVMRKFLAVLKAERDVGKTLNLMHETGVLGRILPEFRPLDCLVSFDGHHHFTVDAHTLRSLGELDRIVANEDYPEPEFREVCLAIGNLLPLRMALLLHDVGKAYAGDHAVNGSEIALGVCDRFGLSETTGETVEFLVYRHLSLFEASQRRDVSDERVIGSLARLVQTEERLEMLYLLTYIDVRSVGPGTWTHWKGAQLREVYEKTLHHLRTGEAPGENLEEALHASELGDDECERVLEHCRQIDTPGYVREILPERMLSHVALAKRLAERGPLEVDTESFGDYHEVILCARDRSGLFTDFAGLLFSEGFNVLGARIYSRRDGVAIDQFWVEIADGVRVGLDVRVERLREKFEAIERERTSARALVLDRSSRYHGSRTFTALYGPRVVLNSQSSANYTVIEVNAGDRPGLLFDLASTLRELDLDVRTAKVSTFGERVHDVFWVLEASGGKVIDSERQKEIQNKLGRRAASIPAPAARQ